MFEPPLEHWRRLPGGASMLYSSTATQQAKEKPTSIRSDSWGQQELTRDPKLSHKSEPLDKNRLLRWQKRVSYTFPPRLNGVEFNTWFSRDILSILQASSNHLQALRKIRKPPSTVCQWCQWHPKTFQGSGNTSSWTRFRFRPSVIPDRCGQ